MEFSDSEWMASIKTVDDLKLETLNDDYEFSDSLDIFSDIYSINDSQNNSKNLIQNKQHIKLTQKNDNLNIHVVDINEKTYISKENLSNINILHPANNTIISTSKNKYISTGFKTGNNKNIIITENKRPKLAQFSYKFKQKEINHDDTCIKYDIVLELFDICVKTFHTKPIKWIKEQFKWSWMHLVINSIDFKYKETDIIRLIQYRKKNENSVLKAILEYSEPSYKYIILAILNVHEKYLEAFDGWYSVKIGITKSIYEVLKNVSFGTKINVFGMTQFNKNPVDILELNEDDIFLQLNINNICPCYSKSNLGYTKKIAFLKPLSSIDTCGGIVPCIRFSIKKIIEMKFLIVVGNYKNTTDNVEDELEKITTLAKKAKKTICKNEITIKKYTNLLISDNTKECLLTWWNPPEIRVNDNYEMVYLIPKLDSNTLHLNTCIKTYFNKL